MNFLKSFLASCLGSIVAIVLLVIIGVFLLASLSNEGLTPIAGDSVLHLKLEAPITELELEDPIAEIFPGAGEQSYGVIQLKEAIQYAKTDDKIKGIFLNTSFLMTGTASLQEIRESLLEI